MASFFYYSVFDPRRLPEITAGLFLDHCAIRFVPRENGIHKVFVRQNGVPIAGSPFQILVGKIDADPALVQASGDGLSKGRTGERLIVHGYFSTLALEPRGSFL